MVTEQCPKNGDESRSNGFGPIGDGHDIEDRLRCAIFLSDFRSDYIFSWYCWLSLCIYPSGQIVKSPVCFLEHHHVGAHSRAWCSCAILAGALLTGLLLLFDLNRILQQENLCLVRIVNIDPRVDRGHRHGIQD
jgi:hypothetical protein